MLLVSQLVPLLSFMYVLYYTDVQLCLFNEFIVVHSLVVETATTIPEDPRAAHKRYKDALKEGFVSAKVVKILIIGAAGVGKTHLFHLLLNEPPPEVRHSTPVMEKPVQVIQTALKNNSVLKNVTDQELYELLAHTVNTAARHNDRKQNDLHPSSPSAPSSEVSDNRSTQKSAGVRSSLHKSGYVNTSNVDKSYQSTEVEEPKLESLHNPYDSLDHELLEVEEQLVPYIAETKDAALLLDVDWMYFIDSGGQPQFHQVLPAFMHHTNLNIFVFRLCDKLSDYPPVEYYDERGTCVSSTPSSLTNMEILQRCAQATQTVDQDGDSRLLIVGTHRDIENECDGETRNDKNEKLLELLTPSMQGHLMYFTADGSELIFPLNAKNPNENDSKLTSELRQTIWSIKDSLRRTKIPLRWLVFHKEIQALSKKKNIVVLSLQECSQVAIRLHMVDDTKAALEFFSDLNVILYYPSILPNVVFTNPQCILDIISEVIKCVAFDRKQHFNSMLIRANNEGIISERLLELVCKKGIIEPKDLIALMVHLKIASKCENTDEYFMPTLLNNLPAQGVQVILSQCSDPIVPIALYHERGWFKCGSFNFFITSLLSSKQWTLAKKGNKLLCVYSNCIKMCFDKSCNVTLIDNASYIEIHLEGDIDVIREVCPEIKRCLVKACEKGVQIAFLCPCKLFGDKHLAILTEASFKHKKVVCSKDQSKAFLLSELGANVEIWFQESKRAGMVSRLV